MQINSEADIPLATEIYGSSDRTAAILCMAWVDEQLTSSIRAVLLDDDEEVEKMIGPNGAIGGFVAKCRLAVLLRIIMPATASDLKVMANLRNRAAHIRDEFSFGDPSVIERVDRLRIYDRIFVDPHLDNPSFLEGVTPPRPFDAGSCRMHFIRCASHAAASLFAMAKRDNVRVADVSLAPFF